MNKEQFLAALRARLTALPKDDLEKTLQYYREMIEDRVEEGMTEFEAVADVGDPAELAEAILQKPVKQTAVRVPKPPKEKKPMSRGKRAALIVCAVLLIAAGVGVILASLNTAGRTGTVKEYTFASIDIRALEIDGGSAEVQLLPAKDDICRVRLVESRNREYEVWTNDETLHIEQRSRWSLFHFSLKEDYLRVYLPEREYDSLWIKSSSGGVSIPADFRFRTAILGASSGGIAFAADVTEELNLQTSSGGIAVANASPASVFVSASSGGVAMADMEPGSVSVRTSSGGARLSDIRCGDLDLTCSSGSIRLSNVISGGKITVDCTSGSVKLDDCDAAALRLECTSGSITGHLLTPKTYVATATSGSISVPSGAGAGVCEVHTTSGSIRFD